MGPTATGKSALAVELALGIGGEIVSADSALVYRGMDIGTAKPGAAERRGVPHHLIDIIDPRDSYSAAAFRRDALRLASEIAARGRIPIFAGGTMLYFRSVTEGLSPLPDSSPEARSAVRRIIAEEGLPKLRELLREADPGSWRRLDARDVQRIGRAYEVYLTCGRSMTDIIRENGPSGCPLEIAEFALMPDPARRSLKPRIAARFDLMLEKGFEREVRALYGRGDLTPDLPSVRCVGYRQMWMYLSGEISFGRMRELAVTATCQLAKRQMTWLRGWRTPLELLDPEDGDNAARVAGILRARGFVP